ncbi:unnamed protein product [Dimorphilus gyrociliatus]|uniref:B box-type domain-containing protein n=1 Tax=Dimorphilus gyrociliatus TaxID=2664684 RepID=A0A7I8VRS3_9ANNE|nr:unnamed protein product [Dimorphilus gyrociliatus]
MSKSLNSSDIVDFDGLCQICRLKNKRKSAPMYCSDCSMPLCKICSDQHRTTKVTADHYVVPKSEKKVEQNCSKHDFAEVRYFCEKCSQLICVNCTMIEHKNHDIVDLNEKIAECEAALRKVMAKISRISATLSEELEWLQKIEINIEEIREEKKIALNAHVIQLQQTIRSQHEKLEQDLDSFLDSKLEKVSDRKKVVKTKWQELKKVQDFASRKGNDKLSQEKFIATALRVSQQAEIFQSPKALDRKEFSGPSIIFLNNQTLGKVENNPKMNLLPTINQDAKPNKLDSIKRSSKVPIVKAAPKTTPRKRKKVYEGLKKSEDIDSGIPLPREISSRREISLPPARSISTISLQSFPKPEIAQRVPPQTARIVSKFKTTSYIKEPCGLAFLSNGKIVIADAENSGLWICDRSGKFQQRVLSTEINYPVGILVNESGNIAVAIENSLKIYSPQSWNCLSHFPIGSGIRGLSIDINGCYVVTEGHALCVYDESGSKLRNFPLGSLPEFFNLAVGGKL